MIQTIDNVYADDEQDADMAFQAEETHAGTDVQPFHKQYRLFHAAFAQFCYTGAQVAIAGACKSCHRPFPRYVPASRRVIPNRASPVINYVTETRGTSSSDAARFLAGAQGVFAIGRFVGAFAMNYVRPRTVFLVFMTMCIIFIAPSITQRGNTGMSMLYLTLFFESIIFPTIVALGMRGLGKYSKKGSGYIVGGVCGGAVVPPLLFVASDAQAAKGRGAPTAFAMVVPLCFFVAAWSYSLAVNFVPAYRSVLHLLCDQRKACN
jgi:FHS family L-fucose permease-like MFS transporter